MKTLKLIIVALFLSSSLATPLTAAAQELGNSLRGHAPLDGDSDIPNPKYWQRDRDPIPRNYVQQPPLIPHSVEGYKITMRFNKCLTCHSWTNYRQAGATKISQTHFKDRDEQVLANVAARRYFCNQCHAPQVDADPLVENTFAPVKAIRGY